MAKESPVSVDGTLAMLTSIIATMVYSRTGEKATEQERVLIETAIKENYAKKKNNMSVDDICSFLDNIYQYYTERENGNATDEYINLKYEKSIQTAHFMSEALIKYTSKGEYGQFFTGHTNVNLEKQLVVTELNNLPDDLKKVLVLAMTSIISDEIYKGNNQPSLIFLDEAWQTLSENPAAAEFVEGLYRKVRKHNGGVGIITQSVSDLDPQHGKLKHLGSVLKTQSAYHFIILDSDFHKAVNNGSFEVSDFELKYYYDRMPDPRAIQYRYSEIFIKGATISAVVRLLVDQYTYMVNTSSADEKDYIIYLTEQHMQTGKTKGESLRLAIDECDKLATKLGSIGAFSQFVRKEAAKIREGRI
jgi:conjugal transfer ATP-binding protein TraC